MISKISFFFWISREVVFGIVSGFGVILSWALNCAALPESERLSISHSFRYPSDMPRILTTYIWARKKTLAPDRGENMLEPIQPKKSTTVLGELKLEDQIDSAWKAYSLDAPKIPNPIPNDTLGLRRICIVINLVIPVSKVIFGLQYLNFCPANTWLPIYILVGALLQSSFLIMFVYKPLRHTGVLVALGLTASLWMIIASINIIVEWKPNFFLGGWRYCNKTFFYFAFFISISEYIILAVLVLYICTHFAFTNPEDIVSSV